MERNNESLKEWYFTIATQYYVTGRFAAAAGLIPVCGNLLHHAVEMYLKGYLCEELSEDERRGLSHRLGDIWQRFKESVGDQEVDCFDETIARLHEFESIRYPEGLVARGMQGVIILKECYVGGVAGNAHRPEPRYEVVVERIDRLVALLFEKANFSPGFFANSFNKEARTYLIWENEVTMWQ